MIAQYRNIVFNIKNMLMLNSCFKYNIGEIIITVSDYRSLNDYL